MHSPSWQLLRLTLITSLAACAPQIESNQETSDAISNPTAETLPESMSKLTIEGNFEGGAYFLGDCHATLIGKARVLTAAHCFGQFLPWSFPKLRVFGQAFTPEQVRFHPDAWADHREVWDDRRPNGELAIPEHDLAVINLTEEVGGVAAKLWSPDDAIHVSLEGKIVEVGGSNNLVGSEATGTLTILGLHDWHGGKILRTTHTPSALQLGDSGGGAFLMVTSLPSSASLGNTTCTPIGAKAGERALVGVSQAIDGTYDYLVPLYLPENAKWVASGGGDTDGDGVCDDRDNCITVDNPQQENCNVHAESDPDWTSNGRRLGDACDPTPCSHASTEESRTVVAQSEIPTVTDDSLAFKSTGRTISDILAIDSVISDAEEPTSETTRIYFCLCRDASGLPIEDPAVCEAAPFYCKRDPNQFLTRVPTEVGGGAAPQTNQTYWHLITILGSGDARKGVIPTTHPDATKKYVWDYQTDYQYWLSKGWMTALPVDAKFGPGTDLAGMFWVRGDTMDGNKEHGLSVSDACGGEFGNPNPTGEICSISDHFVYSVAPDLKSTWTRYKRIPIYRPAPWWSYCANCLNDFVSNRDIYSNPSRVVTFDSHFAATQWTATGGTEVTASFSEALRQSFGDSTKLWVGASEPTDIPATYSRAMMLSSDGRQILGEVSSARAGFGLVARSSTSRMAPRSSFAAAYSRTEGAVYVAGGVSLASGSVMTDVSTYRNGSWSSVSLVDSASAPRNVKAATYSTRNARLWVIDDVGRGVKVLRLIDPRRGTVQTITDLAVLGGLSSVYLSTLSDGRVVLAGNTATGHRVAVLDTTSYRLASTVRVAGRALDVAGEISMAPAVTGSAITVALQRQRATDVALEPVSYSLRSLGL